MARGRPLPGRYPEDVEHLDGAARGELRIPRCLECGKEFWPPGPVCPRDFSDRLEWVTDPGTGTVNTWVACHRQYFPEDQVPYFVVQVTLDSGPNLTTSWTGAEAPVIGSPATVSYKKLADEVTVPEFGPAGEMG